MDNKGEEKLEVQVPVVVNDDNVSMIETRTITYMDTIRTCYINQQQITGDTVMTLLQSYAAATDTTTTSSTTAGGVGTIQCLRGKVRDRYQVVVATAVIDESPAVTSGNPSNSTAVVSNNETIALVTTDRQSGFDRHLAIVPYKGAVLNLCSCYWFQQTRDIIPNHMIRTTTNNNDNTDDLPVVPPHPNVTIARKCTPFPIEFVVRAYMTGSTSTSIWKNYQNGVRNYCGHVLEEGMTKNQKLPKILLTPTTKEEHHDRPISLKEIVSEQWMTKDDLDVCSQAALAIFQRGQDIAARRGLILVDTKYEFGRCPTTQQIMLIDEVHTPDSSRYWMAASYEARIKQQLEPDNIDKEFLRLWFINEAKCDPYDTNVPLPEAPQELVCELSRRYIQLYEMITGQIFDFEALTGNNEEAIAKAIHENIV